MRINNNLMAMNTHRQLGINNAAGSKSVEKLSSGYRINRAGDDAAGLAISEKMRAQIRGLNMASKNSQDGISLIQTAEGALNETHAILQRMRELAVQSSNDTNVTVDRDQIQKEMNQLTTEINRIANTTEFNTMKLLNGDRENVWTTTSVTGLASTTAAITVSDITDYSVDSNPTLASDGSKFGDKLTIVVSATGEFNVGAGSTSGTINIEKTTAGFTVSLNATSTGVVTLTAVDSLVADSNGDFVYNDHGVSFTITADDAALISTGATLTVSGVSVSGTISLEDDFSANGSSAATLNAITSGVTVVENVDNRDVRTIGIVSTLSGATTITLKDSGGVTIHEDEYFIATGTTLNYDAHGISFSYASKSTSGATASIDLSGQAGTLSSSTALTSDNSIKFQVGSNQNQEMALEIGDMKSTGLDISQTSGGTATLSIGGSDVTAYFVATANVTDGTSTSNTEFSLDVSTHDKAAAAVTVINAAIENVSSERSKLGAVQNRLEHTIKNLDTSAENLQAAESRIRDVDMAKEMMEFTKNNILQQAAQAMLAQANQAPQGVLQLLR